MRYFPSLLCLLVLAGCRTEPSTPDPAPVGVDSTERADTTRAAPLAPGQALDLTLPTITGDSLALSSLRGKVVLVNFWATWCAPCRQETPALVALRRELAPQGLEIVGVSLDLEGRTVVAPFAERYGVDYPMLLGDQSLTDRLGGFFGLPTTFVLDREGRLVRRIPGAVQAATLRALLAPLLTAPAV